MPSIPVWFLAFIGAVFIAATYVAYAAMNENPLKEALGIVVELVANFAVAGLVYDRVKGGIENRLIARRKLANLEQLSETLRELLLLAGLKLDGHGVVDISTDALHKAVRRLYATDINVGAQRRFVQAAAMRVDIMTACYTLVAEIDATLARKWLNMRDILARVLPKDSPMEAQNFERHVIAFLYKYWEFRSRAEALQAELAGWPPAGEPKDDETEPQES